MTHSLSQAVADGIVTAQECLFGLSREAIRKLYRHDYCEVTLRVRLRGERRGTWKKMSVSSLIASGWPYEWGGTWTIKVGKNKFTCADVINVTAVAE
jgi:hypothetical protein